MFYKSHTVAAIAVFVSMFIAALLVCAPTPYSKKVWFELFMLLASGGAFAMVSIRMQNKTDSSLPMSIAGVRLSLCYVLYVAILGVPLFFDFYTMKSKYYALFHFIGLCMWAIVLILLRMGERSIIEQDIDTSTIMGIRRSYYLTLSCLVNEMQLSGMWDETLVKDLSELARDFRHGFGKGKDTESFDARIGTLLQELRLAVHEGSNEQVQNVVDRLRLEFRDRELTAKT